MANRRLFLLFLSAMTVSIIIMVIVYGLFIKDLDFNLNVKNPEQAPSPIDIFNQEDSEQLAHEESSRDPASVNTPDEISEKEKTENKAGEDTGNETDEEKKELTNVVPLKSQTQSDESLSEETAGEEPSAPESMEITVPDNAPSSVHFVYMDGFSSRESAEQAMQQLQDRKLAVQPYIRQHKGQIILQFGVFSDLENAAVLANQLRSQNIYVKVD